ncbi:MAG: hypothetical protein M1531_05415 [Chloroflexi bacterium]|nr:hypothetical protein [Chloroflexota bacterium]
MVELVAALARTGEGDDWQVMLSQVRETAGRLVRSIGPSEEPGGLERDAGMKSAITFCAPRSAGIGPEDTLPSVEAVAEAMRGHRVAGLAVLWDSDLCPEETAALTQALVCSRMLCFSARHSRPIGAIVALSQAIRDALRGERLPLVAAFPRLSSPAIAAVALGLAAQGVAAHTGASLPVGGSAAVMGWLASPPRYSGIAPLFTATEPPSPRQMVARLIAWLERP